jgi:histidinol phosphatase-like PHP family hydrolase
VYDRLSHIDVKVHVQLRGSYRSQANSPCMKNQQDILADQNVAIMLSSTKEQNSYCCRNLCLKGAIDEVWSLEAV